MAIYFSRKILHVLFNIGILGVWTCILDVWTCFGVSGFVFWTVLVGILVDRLHDVPEGPTQGSTRGSAI